MALTKEAISEKQKTVSIKRTLDLPVNKVWKGLTEPESFKKWWGPNDYTCPLCRIDLKVGGKYFASMKGKDGKEIYSTGTYKEIISEKKLVMTDSFADEKGNIISAPEEFPGEWPKELIVTLELKDKNGKTELSLNHEGIPAEMYEDCIKGWQESFDKLERNVK